MGGIENLELRWLSSSLKSCNQGMGCVCCVVLCCVVIVRGTNPICGIGWIAEMGIGFIKGFGV